MDPYVIEYKFINVSWFMLLFIISVLIGHFYVDKRLQSILERAKIEWLTIKLVIGGLIGARFYYVTVNWQSYKENLLTVFQISHLTLNLNGALVIGLMIIYWELRTSEVNILTVISSYGQAFNLGLAVGVWSFYFDNFFTYLTALGWSLWFLTAFYIGNLLAKKKSRSGELLVFITALSIY